MRSDSEVLAQIASDVAGACRRSMSEADRRDAEHREWIETKIQKYVDEVVSGIKSRSIIRGRFVETELHLASKRECELVAIRLNDLFPGAKWKHFAGHRLCGIFQGRGCDCSWDRQGCYHGVYCALESLLASAEGVVQPKVAATSENLTDLRKLVGGVCKPLRDVVALKASQERLLIPAGAPFLVKLALPARNDVIVQCCGIEGWLPAMQEVEVISKPLQLNYRYSDVVLNADVLVSIRPESETFTTAVARLKSPMAFKPDRLAMSDRWFEIYRNCSATTTHRVRATVVRPDAQDLIIMRIRADGKDLIDEPMSARNFHLGGGFAWPVVRAGSEVEITLAVSKGVLDRALPPFGSTKGDLLRVDVPIGLILTGERLR